MQKSLLIKTCLHLQHGSELRHFNFLNWFPRWQRLDKHCRQKVYASWLRPVCKKNDVFIIFPFVNGAQGADGLWFPLSSRRQTQPFSTTCWCHLLVRKEWAFASEGIWIWKVSDISWRKNHDSGYCSSFGVTLQQLSVFHVSRLSRRPGSLLFGALYLVA